VPTEAYRERQIISMEAEEVIKRTIPGKFNLGI